MQGSALGAACFFERRFSLTMRAFGSPKMPRTVPSGRKPGNAYASHSRRFRRPAAPIDNWRASLRWQRLKSYQRFAAMIDRHWDGIAAYCRPEKKVSLGSVEGLDGKIRVLQRRAYGLRDEEYLRFKILTAMLPEL